jgi:hypothetical protein
VRRRAGWKAGGSGRRRSRRFYGALLAVGTALAAPAACSSSSAGLQGEGGTCSLTSDCQEGLVCIPQSDGSRKCSSDLSGIQQTEEAGGADATMPTPQKDGGKTTDGGKPAGDGGSPPPQDGGNQPQDTGSPPQDTGTPPQDTGAPPQDSGGGVDAPTD